MFCEISQIRFGLTAQNEKTEASNLFRSCPDIAVITCNNNFLIKLIEKSKFALLI